MNKKDKRQDGLDPGVALKHDREAETKKAFCEWLHKCDGIRQ
jgi:hypothetical protein